MENEQRTFFNKNVNYMTLCCFEDKVSLKEFVADVSRHLIPFEKNMENLGKTEERYPEQWMELFLVWYELYQED